MDTFKVQMEEKKKNKGGEGKKKKNKGEKEENGEIGGGDMKRIGAFH